jgi:hypothetical protein
LKEFRFWALGIRFEIAIGTELPHAVRRQCCFTSPRKPLFVGSCDDYLIREFGGIVGAARVAGKLRNA